MLRRNLGLNVRGFGLAFAVAMVAAPAYADPPKAAKQDVADAKKDVKEAKKELADAKKDVAKEAKGAKADAKEDAKEAKQDAEKKVAEAKGKLDEAMAKLRETRAERRKEHQEKVRGKYGKLLENKDAQEELRTHGLRMARLHRMEALAKNEGLGDVEKRIDELKSREEARHEKRMSELEAKAKEATK